MRLRTFGTLAIMSAGESGGDVRIQRRQLALLAALAASGPTGLSRTQLIGFFWADADDERARHALDQLLYASRRVVGGDAVVESPTSLTLDGSVLASDVAQYQRALDRGDLEAAVAVYSGPFLDGFHVADAPEFERWVEGRRRYFADAFVQALMRLATAASAKGDYVGAVVCLRRAAASEPVSGKVALALMRALISGGEPSAAINAGRVHAALVRDQLDADPDPAVQKLLAELRAGTVRTPVAQNRLSEGPDEVGPAVTSELISRRLAENPGVRNLTAEALPAATEPLVAAGGDAAPTVMRLDQGVASGGWNWRALAMGGALLGLFALAGTLMRRGRGARAPVSLVNLRRMTNAGGLEFLPALSPDAKFLAFASTSEVGRPAKIFLQPTDGGRAVAITDSLAGEQTSPDWSPDGGRVVFISTDTGQSSIMVTSPTGGGVRTVYQVRNVKFKTHSVQSGPLAPRWSPDGLHIAFGEADSILLISANGTGLSLVGRATDVHSLAWSPDGRWLAGVRDNAGFVYGNLPRTFGNLAASTVFVISAAGGTPQMVSDSTTLNNSPVWLRDGSGLLYVSSSGGGRDIYEQRIGRSGFADGPARRVTTGLDAHTIALSRDGRRLAYSKYTRDVNIWLLRIPPGGHASVRSAVPVTRGNQAIESVKLSPDGKWLAYDSDLNGNADIFVVAADGGTARQLTEDPADDMWPDWSPDGSQLAFHSFRTGHRAIFTMNADGSGVSAVTASPMHQRYAVWGTNNSLAFLRDSGTGFALEEVTRSDRTAPWGRPRVLATEFDMLLTGSTPDHSAYLGDVDGFPARISLGRGSVTPLLSSKAVPYAFNPRMPGDGRTLYFFSSDSAGSYIGAADVKRGTTRKVVTFDEPGRDFTRGAFDTDGRRFFFTIAHHRADIWLADVELR